MQLLTGPAGSGKTFRILERFREALRRRDSGVRLLAPTATMAQHLQHRLAREGFVFRPGQIQTLSRFVDSFATDVPLVSEPLLYLMVEEAAQRVKQPEFARVVGMSGFCAALARTMAELSSAGCDSERLAANLARRAELAPLGEAFLAVYREVDSELGRRGLATRSQRLARVAERIARDGMPGIRAIFLDGFYALPDPELEVIGAICRHADVTVTLPKTTITETTRARLVGMGLVEEACTWERTPPPVKLCAAPSLEREADEIARRILEQANAGRPFRDMGVIVRSQDVYEPILRATFDRFGIPARFYFDSDLTAHALARCMTGMVDAMLGGWDHAETLAAVRLVPGIACDEFDFAVRARTPGKGLAELRRLACDTAPPAALLQSFEQIEAWRRLSLKPAEWATRLRDLRGFCAPAICEPGTYETAAIARGQATVLEQFDSAMDEAARALEERHVTLREFWRAAKSVLRLTPLRVDDGRRNVVHVLGAHEARQWRLPVVFVCGLVEKQFPKFHTQDPFFPEAARAHLKQSGIRVRTAADFEGEERFLFDWAITRATDSLTLTYPLSDARGQQNLPSLYLEDVRADRAEWKSVLPQPAERGGAPVRGVVASRDLLDYLASRHSTFRPTGLESYLQCAFQFFARYSLHLDAAPARPDQRLDFLTQGSIVHEVLAALIDSQRPLDEVFEETFARNCQSRYVPSGYRTESGRLRMLADVRAFVEDPGWMKAAESHPELKFRFSLADDVEISGRIDRVDVTGADATVIDFKYSGAQNTKDRGKSEFVLQSQLYLLALERFPGLRPEGMFFWGFKGTVQRTQWIPTPSWRREAIETVLRIAGEIRAGRIEPHPADPDKCRFCDFRDVCRFVTVATGEPDALMEVAAACD